MGVLELIGLSVVFVSVVLVVVLTALCVFAICFLDCLWEEMGTGAQAELVRLYRGQAQAMRCPGDAACPVWSERLAGR